MIEKIHQKTIHQISTSPSKNNLESLSKYIINI